MNLVLIFDVEFEKVYNNNNNNNNNNIGIKFLTTLSQASDVTLQTVMI